MIFLDFDGLDGSLAVLSRSSYGTRAAGTTDTEGVARAEIPSRAGTDKAESTASTAILRDTISIRKGPSDTEIMTFIDDSTESMQRVADSPKTESGVFGITETMFRPSETSEVAVLPRIHSKPEGPPDAFDSAHRPSYSSAVNTKGGQAAIRPFGLYPSLSVLGIVVVFLAGMLSGGGLVYLWLGEGEGLFSENAEKIALLKPHQEDATVPVAPNSTHDEPTIIAKTKLPQVGPEVMSDETDSATVDRPLLDAESTLEVTLSKSPQEMLPATPVSKSADDEPSATNQIAPSRGELEATQEHTNAGVMNGAASSWTIPFTFNQQEVPIELLRGVLPDLQRCEGTFVITGHTCNLGELAVNRQIGLARANSVRRAFVQLGFSRDRVEIESAGADQPLATNETEEGRKANRRAVIECRS